MSRGRLFCTVVWLINYDIIIMGFQNTNLGDVRSPPWLVLDRIRIGTESQEETDVCVGGGGLGKGFNPTVMIGFFNLRYDPE